MFASAGRAFSFVTAVRHLTCRTACGAEHVGVVPSQHRAGLGQNAEVGDRQYALSGQAAQVDQFHIIWHSTARQTLVIERQRNGKARLTGVVKPQKHRIFKLNIRIEPLFQADLRLCSLGPDAHQGSFGGETHIAAGGIFPMALEPGLIDPFYRRAVQRVPGKTVHPSPLLSSPDSAADSYTPDCRGQWAKKSPCAARDRLQPRARWVI